MFKRRMLIRRLVKSEFWGDRRVAAEALGQLGDHRAVAPLIRALGDSEPTVRRASAEALGQLGESQWLQWVKGDSGDFPRLVMSKDIRAVEGLIMAVGNHHLDVRAEAANALVKLGGDRVVPLLLKALQDRDWNMRQSAATALGILGDESAVGPLIHALRDREFGVRLWAAIALGKLGDLRSIEPLSRVLGDRVYIVRKAAVIALGELGDSRAVKPLIRALEDRHEAVRQAAEEALGKFHVSKGHEESEPDDARSMLDEERQFQEIDALLSFVEQTRLTQASVNRFDEAIGAADSMWEGRQHAVCKDLATLLATLRFYVHPELRQPGAIAIVGKAPGGQAGNPVDVTTMIARASSCRVFRIWRVDDGGYIVKAAHEHLHAVDTDPPGVPSKETASIRLEWLEKRMDGGLIVAIPHGWERTPSTNFVVAPTNSRRISACGFDFLSPSANAQVFQGNAEVTREMIMGATRTLLRERLDRATSISEEWLDWPDSYALLSWFEYNRDNHRFRSAKIDRFFTRDHVIVTAELAGEVPDMDPFDREEVERFLKSFRIEYFD